MENDPTSKSDKPELSKTAEPLYQHGRELKYKASEVAQDVQKHASANVEYATAVTKEKLSDGFNALNDYIKTNPVTAIVAAASFGYVLAWLRNK